MGRSKTRNVERAFFIRASPRKVFRAITDSGQIIRWLSETADLDLRAGGRYVLVFAGGWRHEGSIADLKPGRSVTLEWSWPGVDVSGTRLTLSVARKGEGTVFRMVHTGFPKDEKWVDLYGGAEWGWTYYGMNLKSVLETGHDLRSRFDG